MSGPKSKGQHASQVITDGVSSPRIIDGNQIASFNSSTVNLGHAQSSSKHGDAYGSEMLGSVRGLPHQDVRQNKRRDTYLSTLLSSRISERTNMLSRMQGASSIDAQKNSITQVNIPTEPPSAYFPGNGSTLKPIGGGKNTETDSLHND